MRSYGCQSANSAAGSIYIANRSSGSVVFYLETENTERTEHTLTAGEAATFTADPNDTWFNVEVHSAGGVAKYGFDASDRIYFAWQGEKLEIFKMAGGR